MVEVADYTSDDWAWTSLWVGYAIAFALVFPFLFFDTDQGCDWVAYIWAQCHRSRRAEQLYIGVAMAFAIAGPIVWRYLKDEVHENTLAMCSLLGIIRVVLLATILDMFVAPKPHPLFYGGSCARGKAYREKKLRINTSVMLNAEQLSNLEELNTLVEEALNLHMGNNLTISQEAIGPVVFLMLIFAEPMLASRDYLSDSVVSTETYIMAALWIVYCVCLFILYIRGWCKLHPMQERIHMLVQVCAERLNREGERESGEPAQPC